MDGASTSVTGLGPGAARHVASDGPVLDRHNSRHGARQPGRRRAGCDRDASQHPDQHRPFAGHGHERELSLPQYAGRRLRAHDRSAGIREIRALGHHALGEPGRGHRYQDSAGEHQRGDHGQRGRPAAQHHDTGSRRAVRQDAHRGAARVRGDVPRHLCAGAVGAGSQPARQRPDGIRVGHELLVERHARPVEQLHDRRPGQQRPERDRPAAADEQHGHHSGSAADHESVRGRVRAGGGLDYQRRDEERHQHVPRIGLRFPERREPQRAQQPRQGSGPCLRPLPGRTTVWRHRRRAGAARQDVFLRVVPAVDRPAARIGLHPQRGADRGWPPSPAGRRWHAAAGAGTPPVPARRSDTDCQVCDVCDRCWRPDLHGATRVADRFLVDRLQQRSGDCPDRPAVRHQPHVDRSLSAGAHAGEYRDGPGDAPGIDHREHVESALAQHLAEQRVVADHVERVPGRVVTPGHSNGRTGCRVGSDSVARNHRTGDDRLQRRREPDSHRPGGQLAAVPLQRYLPVPEHPHACAREALVQGGFRRALPIREELLLPDDSRPAALRDARFVRQRRR